MGSEPKIPGVEKTLYSGINGIDWNSLKYIDVLIHQAANNDTTSSDHDEMMHANLKSAIKLVEIAFLRGCRKFIYASSTAVYGNMQPPFIENTLPFQQINAYAESKLKFEEYMTNYAKENEVSVIGMRYCNVYGMGEQSKGKRMSMIGQMLQNVIQDKPIHLFKYGQQKRDWIYVKDVAMANCQAITKNVSGIYNIGTGIATSFNDLIGLIGGITKKEIRVNYIHNPLPQMYQDHTLCSTTKAEQELGFWNKTNIRDGIEDYYQNLIS